MTPSFNQAERFHQQVNQRFGVLPNFFCSAAAAPGLMEELWQFTKSAYLDSPLPSLFKERLFVYLSRFCPVRYCIVRHVGFLMGLGHPAGDATAQPHTAEQVIDLLSWSMPDAALLNETLNRLETQPQQLIMPEENSRFERDLFETLAVIFLEPRQSLRARNAVRQAVGEASLEILTAYLAFIRTAHYWTETHPELAYEPDMVSLMQQHRQLSQLLLDPTEAEWVQQGTFLRQTLTNLQLVQERLRQSQQREAFMLQLTDTLRPLTDPIQIQAVAVNLLGEALQVDRCYYAELDQVRQVVVINQEYLRSASYSLVGEQPLALFQPVVDLMVKDEPIICDNIATHPVLAAEADAYRERGVEAFVMVPLVKQGLLNVFMGLTMEQPRSWTTHDVQLLSEVAERAWAAIECARAEEALKKSEERLLLATHAAQIGTFIYYPGEDRGEPDAQMLALYGLPSDTTLNLAKALAEVLHPADRQRYANEVAQALDPAGRGKLDSDTRIVHPDGSVHWMNVRGQVIFENGQATRMPGVSTDITERKRREQQQDFLLGFSDSLRTLADKPTIEQTSLQLLAEYLGLDRTYIATVYRQEDRAVIGSEYRRTELGLVPISGELHMTDFPESFRQVEEQTLVVHNIATDVSLSERDRQSLDAINLTAFVVASIRIGERDVIWSLVASTTTPRHWTFDEVQLIEVVAERTWAAAERAKTQEALQESQKRFESIANLVPDLLWDSEPDGVTNWCNQRWLEYTGQRLEEAIGWGWANVIHPDDRAASVKRYGEAITAGQLLRQEHRIRRHDGEYRWFVVSASPLKDAMGQVVKMYGAATDIHELKRLEATLLEADQRKDEFLAMLAHELRNPMATISIGMQVLTMSTDTGLNNEIIPAINRQVAHLAHMLDDLLDVSRISRGKINLKLELVELTALVTSAVTAIRPQYELEQQQLHWMPADAQLLLEGDATRLTQVVTNLLTNGLRYTGEGGQVWVSLTHQAQQAILQVRDNGIGLTPEQQVSIFELFMQTDNSLARQRGGLGIGLTLVKQLVELHGGRVEAYSPGLGQGSVFSVYLPLLEQPKSKAVTQEPSARASSAQRILVIDDNSDAVLTTAMLLKLKGYDVRTASSGEMGLEVGGKWQPAFILCDIGMPGLDGYQTARLIRQQPWGGRVRLIALSGYGQEEDLRRSLAAGFDAHLIKPVNLSALLTLLDERAT